MTSDELNEAISAICDREELEIQGGKCIPYIGWYWRYVDFEAESYSFGIIPIDTPSATICGGDGVEKPIGPFSQSPLVGFMENNKWGHPYARQLSPEEWAEVKRLLEVAVSSPTRETTRAAWDYIQTFSGTPATAG